MRALYLIIPILCILAIAYRYYSAFIAAKVMSLDDSRVTPAHTKYDGHNYYPTSRWVLFGHHFAAITGAGPLIGPVLAAQFGCAPGPDLAGRRRLPRRRRPRLRHPVGLDAARRPVARRDGAHRNRPRGRRVRRVAILFIIVIAMAGLGLAVVGALAESAWATFTIGATIPLALLMGFHMSVWRKGKIRRRPSPASS